MGPPPTFKRLRLSLKGLLQGIGFRPFVFQLAHELELKGWVQNSPQGVSLEVEGDCEAIEKFFQRLCEESPPDTILESEESDYLEPSTHEDFKIRDSDYSGSPSTIISPDIATCPNCLLEIFDSSNRRYLYPFTNCTHCGPRFSIIESLPYDRQNTSMKQFQMCGACQSEYDDPTDRRFHAQPNACASCGPKLELWDSSGSPVRGDAIEKAVETLQEGAILAIKGIGGFHLMVQASNNQAVYRLRTRKHREEKPFALMFPSIQSVKILCHLSGAEKQMLLSPEAPIVLLQRKPGDNSAISSGVAPSNPYLGVMLPSTPLHHILMERAGAPMVATSGNISSETICTQEAEAVNRLTGIADFFLVHNRPIVRHADDSIVRMTLGSEQVLRRARGYAPLPITTKKLLAPRVAVGGYLKNTIAVSKEHNIFVSQHIGDLHNAQTVSAFEETLESLTTLYGVQTSSIVCDSHPDYPSTQRTIKNQDTRFPVQHHVAHIFSCMAEHDLEEPLLGIAWDGSGYGLDGTVWGGEFIHVTAESIHRVACWRPFPLPGGESAVNEPRRSALGLLHEVLGEAIFAQPELLKSFSSDEITVLKTMLDNKINCPKTSSCGRLFDAVASMTGIRQLNSFEGQAAMELEFLTQGTSTESCYSINLIEDGFGNSNRIDNGNHLNLNLKYQLDETNLVRELLCDISEKRCPSLIATKFHNTLAESIVSIAKRIGEERVVLSGGCFQNLYLTERTVHRLHREGFRPYWHQRIPPNDGGLALGQIFAADWLQKRKGVSNVFGDTW